MEIIKHRPAHEVAEAVQDVMDGNEPPLVADVNALEGPGPAQWSEIVQQQFQGSRGELRRVNSAPDLRKVAKGEEAIPLRRAESSKEDEDHAVKHLVSHLTRTDDLIMRPSSLYQDVLILTRALQSVYFPNLRNLRLRKCIINADEMSALASALPSGLHLLELWDNNMGDDGACALAPGLPSVPHLRTLEIGGNRIDDRGACALAAALPSGLQTLNLIENAIGDNGARALAARLPVSLHALELYSNNIGDEGLCAIARHMPPHLHVLLLQENQIGDRGVSALAQCLPVGLQKLRLGLNKIGDAGASALSLHLPTDLLVLDLKLNQIGAKGAGALAKGLPAGLQTLQLDLSVEEQEYVLKVVADAYPPVTSEAILTMFEGDLAVRARMVLKSNGRCALAHEALRSLWPEKSILARDVRVMLCGEAMVGKTQLIHSILKLKPTSQILEDYANDTSSNSLSLSQSMSRDTPPTPGKTNPFRRRSSRMRPARRAESPPEGTRFGCFWTRGPLPSQDSQLRRTSSESSESPRPSSESSISPRDMKGMSQDLGSPVRGTRGIEVEHFSWDNRVRFSFWDLGGREEFHVLHDHLMPDSSYAGGKTTLFVLVLKLLSNNEERGERRASWRQMQTQHALEGMRYWLRLIASTTGLGHRQVIIAINRWDGDKDRLLESQLVRDVQEQLKMHDNLSCLGVYPIDARKNVGIGDLWRALLGGAEKALQSVPRTPVPCEMLIRVLENERRKRAAMCVMDGGSFWDLVTQTLKKVNMRLPKDCSALVSYLQDVGQIVHLKDISLGEAGSMSPGPELDGSIVLDPGWLGQGVVGELLGLWLDVGGMSPEVERARPKVVNGFVDRKELEVWYNLRGVKNVTFALELLKFLELIIDPADLGRPSGNVLVPALLKPGDTTRVAQNWTASVKRSSEQHLVGYRLGCKNRQTKVLGSTLFERLQASMVHEYLDNVVDIAKGIITLKRNKVALLLEYDDDDYIHVLAAPLTEDSKIMKVFEELERVVDHVTKKAAQYRRAVALKVEVMHPLFVKANPYVPSSARSWWTLDQLSNMVEDGIDKWGSPGVQRRLSLAHIVPTKHLRPLLDSKLQQQLCLALELENLLLAGATICPQSAVHPGTEKRERKKSSVDRSLDTLFPPKTKEKLDPVHGRASSMHLTFTRNIDELLGMLKSLKGHVGDLRGELETRLATMELLFRGSDDLPCYCFISEDSHEEEGDSTMARLDRILWPRARVHVLCEAGKPMEAHRVKGQKGHVVRDLENWVRRVLPSLQLTVFVAVVALKLAAFAKSTPAIAALLPAHFVSEGFQEGVPLEDQIREIIGKPVLPVGENSSRAAAFDDLSIRQQVSLLKQMADSSLGGGYVGGRFVKETYLDRRRNVKDMKMVVRRVVEDCRGSSLRRDEDILREDFGLQRAVMGSGDVRWLCHDCWKKT